MALCSGALQGPFPAAQKVLPAATARHAVLSHGSHQQAQNLSLAYPSALDQTDHHGQIADNLGLQLRLLRFPGRPACVGPLAALAVLQFLLLLAFRGAVVGHAALVGASPTMRLAAPKRTSQIPAPCVAGMGQEENPTLSATAQTGPQRRVGAKDPAQLDVIRPDQSAGAAAAVPIRAALKLLLDFDN